jgi:hypothetical protein
MLLGMTRQLRCREVRSYDNGFPPSIGKAGEFFFVKPDGKHPLLSDRRNIVVIADEAHRSQYDFIDGFAKHFWDALPKASFIGFTGTPMERGDKHTQAVFDDWQRQKPSYRRRCSRGVSRLQTGAPR